MPISIKQFADKIQNLDGTSDDSFELSQMAGTVDVLENLVTFSVDTSSSLPLASENQGRLIYVEDVCQYYKSNGNSWNTCWAPPPVPPIPQGALWGWGNNCAPAGGGTPVGVIGDGTSINRTSPVSVVGGFTDWIAVDGGSFHALGLRIDGTIWAWGGNKYGELGNNQAGKYNQSSPVSIVGGFTDWCAISGSSVGTGQAAGHSLALRSDGTAWSWGLNNYGQLGINSGGSSASKSSPVSVVGGFTDWWKISAGGAHSVGLRCDGTLWAWGFSNRGQLGNNCDFHQSSPVSVVGGFTDWCQVSAGALHNVAVRSDGTAWAWGCNRCGSLGIDYGSGSQSSPVSVVGGFTDWCQVSAGLSHSAAIRTDGTLWTWGQSYSFYGGILGDGFKYSRSSPVSVVGGFTDWCQVSAGTLQTAAVRTDGTMWAWGLSNTSFGVYLGAGESGSQSSPVSVLGGFTDWVQVTHPNLYTTTLGLRAV